MSYIHLLFLIISSFFSQTAHSERVSLFNDTINNQFIDEYCDLSEGARAARIQYLETLVHFTPIKKKPFNYNLSHERARKKAIEQSITYDRTVYPEQEAAYQLGLIYSGIPCEILQFKKAVYYLSLAGRKPETHFLLGKIYYNRSKTPQNIAKAIDFFENAGELGIEQGYINAIQLLRKHKTSHKQFKLDELEIEYAVKYKLKN